MVTRAEVKAYITFPIEMLEAMQPTDDEWDAWIAANEIKFEGRTGDAFDETIPRHYDLFMSYMKLSTLNWFLSKQGYRSSVSTEAGSAIMTELRDVRKHIEKVEKKGDPKWVLVR